MSPRTRAFLQLLLAVPGSCLWLAYVVLWGSSYLQEELLCAMSFGIVALWWSIIALPSSYGWRCLLGMGLMTGFWFAAWLVANCFSVTMKGENLLGYCLHAGGMIAVGVWNFIRLFKPSALTKR